MCADIGISTVELGYWLEHIVPPGKSESNAARIFGADFTFYVLGVSSTSNRTVCQGAIGADDMVIVGCNCHKSLNHGLTISGARPGDYTVLVLFSVGSSKGKWGTLLENLIESKISMTVMRLFLKFSLSWLPSFRNMVRNTVKNP
ncbi:MAG: arginine decarboxylase [Euryarchaeota archaeon]|nr:arginine decarboxylase [Euryarchaeota archaeon]